MQKLLLLTALSFCVFFVIDLIWLNFIVSDFLLAKTNSFARLSEAGEFEIITWSALLAWGLVALGLGYFVQLHSSTALSATLKGALFGFVSYGIFEFTNYSFINHYPFEFVLLDLGWGTFSCGLVSYLVFLLRMKISSIRPY